MSVLYKYNVKLGSLLVSIKNQDHLFEIIYCRVGSTYNTCKLLMQAGKCSSDPLYRPNPSSAIMEQAKARAKGPHVVPQHIFPYIRSVMEPQDIVPMQTQHYIRSVLMYRQFSMYHHIISCAVDVILRTNQEWVPTSVNSDLRQLMAVIHGPWQID